MLTNALQLTAKSISKQTRHRIRFLVNSTLFVKLRQLKPLKIVKASSVSNILIIEPVSLLHTYKESRYSLVPKRS